VKAAIPLPPVAPSDEEHARRLLTGAVAFVWLATGLLVVHPSYREVGVRYLGPLGLGPGVMVAACLGEVVLAVTILVAGIGPRLAAFQAAVILGFTLTLAVLDPWLLVHPYGVLGKNLPLLAILACLAVVSRRGWTPAAWRLLRWGMAVIWVTEGIFPDILFPQPDTVGVPASVLRVGGVAAVLAGVASLTLCGRWLARTYLAQMVGLVVLTVVPGLRDPLLWVHPFGPLTKNVPLLAGTFVLYRRCRSALNEPPL